MLEQSTIQSEFGSLNSLNTCANTVQILCTWQRLDDGYCCSTYNLNLSAWTILFFGCLIEFLVDDIDTFFTYMFDDKTEPSRLIFFGHRQSRVWLKGDHHTQSKLDFEVQVCKCTQPSFGMCLGLSSIHYAVLNVRSSTVYIQSLSWHRLGSSTVACLYLFTVI